MLAHCPGNATLSIWPAALKTHSWDFAPLQGLIIVGVLLPFGPSRHQLPIRLFNWTGPAAPATPALSNATPSPAPATRRARRTPPVARDPCIFCSILSSRSASRAADGFPQITRFLPRPAEITPVWTTDRAGRSSERWVRIGGGRSI